MNTRIFTLFFISTLMLCCNSKTDIEYYIDSLSQIKSPIELKDNSNVYLSPNFDKRLFEKFKTSYSNEPIGKLFVNENFIATLEYAVADNGYAPILVTYDIKGNKQDSLYLLQKTGYGDFGQTKETAIIDNYFNITIRDTTKIWKVDEDFNPIDSTVQTSYKETMYKISKSGKIEKQK